ncbi:mucin-5AC isoform X2 [Oncorhynchus tshawytscha]|uniref:mucin-5AC isoform X2 n=1 Tax=Oncorhynchus tshawytscha TaxID=74940 RepID=UPI000D0A4FD6|nr:mucin-5AC isoform X2 [Oncorhynchus tshawytscha]
MSLSEFEIKLGREVKKYPNLYSSRDTIINYNDWIIVAHILSKGKREMDFSFCRTTWKKMRKNYVREHNTKIKSGNSSVGLKDPEILQELNWLSPFIKHKAQPTNIPGGEGLVARGRGETGGSRDASLDRYHNFTTLSTPAADGTFTPPVTTHIRPFRHMSTLTQSGDSLSSSKPSSSSTSGPVQPRKRTQDRVDQAPRKNPKNADKTREHGVSSMGGGDEGDTLLVLLAVARGQGETGGSGEASMDRFPCRFTPLSTPEADSTFTPPVTTSIRHPRLGLQSYRPTSTLKQSGGGPTTPKPSSSSTSGPAQPRKRTQHRVEQAPSKNLKTADNTREHGSLVARGQAETGGSGEASIDRDLCRFNPLFTPAAGSTVTPSVTTHIRPTSTLKQSGGGPTTPKPSSSSTSGPAQPRKRTQHRVEQAPSKNLKTADNSREHGVSSMGGSDDGDALLSHIIISTLSEMPPELKSQAKSDMLKLLSAMQEKLSQHQSSTNVNH